MPAIITLLVLSLAALSLSVNGFLTRTTSNWLNRYQRVGRLHAEVTIILPDGGGEKKIQVKDNQFLLLALEDAKIKQRFVCRTGTCSACAVRVTNGNAADFIELEDPDYVSGKKTREGFSLSCVAFVKKDGAIIEINQEEAYDNA